MGDIGWPAAVTALVLALAKALDWLYERYQTRRRGSADERKTIWERVDSLEEKYDKLRARFDEQADKLAVTEDERDTIKRKLIRFVNAFQYLAWDNTYLSKKAGVDPPSAYQYQYLIDESVKLNGGENPND